MSKTSPAVEGCVLSLSTDKTNYGAGNLITLTATVKNRGKHTVYMPDGPALLSYKVKVVSTQGEETPKTLYYQQLLNRPTWSFRILPLKPGEQVMECINLGRAFDLSLAGDYRITAPRIIGKDGGFSEIVMLPSNTLSISIREGDRKFYDAEVKKQ